MKIVLPALNRILVQDRLVRPLCCWIPVGATTMMWLQYRCFAESHPRITLKIARCVVFRHEVTCRDIPSHVVTFCDLCHMTHSNVQVLITSVSITAAAAAAITTTTTTMTTTTAAAATNNKWKWNETTATTTATTTIIMINNNNNNKNLVYSDTVTVSHLRQCNTNSKVWAMSAQTLPYRGLSTWDSRIYKPGSRNRKHLRGLTGMHFI